MKGLNHLEQWQRVECTLYLNAGQVDSPVQNRTNLHIHTSYYVSKHCDKHTKFMNDTFGTNWVTNFYVITVEEYL